MIPRGDDETIPRIPQTDHRGRPPGARADLRPIGGAGPTVGGKQIFADAGANFIIKARSGEPYSAQSNITQEAAFGINDRSTLDGSINGSRLPWQMGVDMRIDKSFKIKWSDTKKSTL